MWPSITSARTIAALANIIDPPKRRGRTVCGAAALPNFLIGQGSRSVRAMVVALPAARLDTRAAPDSGIVADSATAR
ncbi:hypothetical protein ACFVUS_01375 [Nocardia sp. NPDC058058]|uniref:hypothetical protein n=1 Tax=Nocardia sp. NPDC058058 TaxID=3346317 RepID=UPI0036D91881